MPSPRPLVIGNAAVDALAFPLETFPERGRTRFFESLTLKAGGCGVNSAIALARLGFPCDLVAPVGDDLLGDFLVGEISRHLDPGHMVRYPGHGTPFTFVAVDGEGERSFIHAPQANAVFSRDDIPDTLVDGRRHVLIAGSMIMATLDGEPTAGLLATARARGATTLLDTVLVDAPRAEWERCLHPCLPHADWFMPSRLEASALTGEVDPPAMARRLQEAGAHGVVVKLGPEGAYLRATDGREERVAARPVSEVVDTTGAGDAWCAGFLTALAEGLPPPRAVVRGNAVAARAITAMGATDGIPPLTEVEGA